MLALREDELVEYVAKRLDLPIQQVRIFACPICHKISFAGYLTDGSEIKVRCKMSSCAHHIKGMEWVARVSGAQSGKMHIKRCPSPLCKYPCRDRAPGMQSEIVQWNNGMPVCNWAWSCAYIAPKSRLLVWCVERTCANATEGFIIRT